MEAVKTKKEKEFDIIIKLQDAEDYLELMDKIMIEDMRLIPLRKHLVKLFLDNKHEKSNK